MCPRDLEHDFVKPIIYYTKLLKRYCALTLAALFYHEHAWEVSPMIMGKSIHDFQACNGNQVVHLN
jgi:hypothetical protein